MFTQGDDFWMDVVTSSDGLMADAASKDDLGILKRSFREIQNPISHFAGVIKLPILGWIKLDANV